MNVFIVHNYVVQVYTLYVAPHICVCIYFFHMHRHVLLFVILTLLLTPDNAALHAELP